MQPILVVEDDTATREMLVDALREEGFPVIASDEGRKALELASAIRPSVVLLDLAMEGMDGRTFLERRRDIPALAATPVLVITASAADGVNADAVLAKPLVISEVLANVHRLLGRAAVAGRRRP